MRQLFVDVTNAGYDDGVPTSILREVTNLKNLQNEHVLQIHMAEVHTNRVQMQFEHLDWNLKEFVKRNYVAVLPNSLFLRQVRNDKPINGLSVDLTRNVIRQVLEGLAYCHSRGVMHRNLKPDNILVSENGKVKLSDFTMSRMVSVPHFEYTPEDPKERERSGREARRLWYRPPELLFRKKMYSFEVDMWAVGCLLAEICLASTLFTGEHEIDQLLKIFSLTGTPSEEIYD